MCSKYQKQVPFSLCSPQKEPLFTMFSVCILPLITVFVLSDLRKPTLFPLKCHFSDSKRWQRYALPSLKKVPFLVVFSFCSSIGTKSTSNAPPPPTEIMYRPVWRMPRYANVFFSSPEPNAHWWAYSIGRHPLSVVHRPSVNIFKYLLLRSHWANWSQILCGGSMSRGNKSSFKRSWSHDQDGRHAHIW